MGEKRYFTLGEALRALPLVKRVVGDMQGAQGVRMRIHGELSAGIAVMEGGRQEALQREFDRETERLKGFIVELEGIGVELKDIARGLLDFPSSFEGREILLCWKGDEETITHWHELEEGFAGRKPVALLRGHAEA